MTVHITYRLCLKCRWIRALVWEEPGDPGIMAGHIQQMGDCQCGSKEYEFHDAPTCYNSMAEIEPVFRDIPHKTLDLVK